jgi:hypothetical protein
VRDVDARLIQAAREPSDAERRFIINYDVQAITEERDALAFHLAFE